MIISRLKQDFLRREDDPKSLIVKIARKLLNRMLSAIKNEKHMNPTMI